MYEYACTSVPVVIYGNLNNQYSFTFNCLLGELTPRGKQIKMHLLIKDRLFDCESVAGQLSLSNYFDLYVF